MTVGQVKRLWIDAIRGVAGLVSKTLLAIPPRRDSVLLCQVIPRLADREIPLRQRVPSTPVGSRDRVTEPQPVSAVALAPQRAHTASEIAAVAWMCLVQQQTSKRAEEQKMRRSDSRCPLRSEANTGHSEKRSVGPSGWQIGKSTVLHLTNWASLRPSLLPNDRHCSSLRHSGDKSLLHSSSGQ